MPLGDHAAHWSNLLKEIVRNFLMYYPSWRHIEPERKAGVIGNIRSQFDLSSLLHSPNWPKIQKGNEQQLAKIYTNNKLALKHEHWVLKPERTPDEEGIRSRRLLNITLADWDKQIAFWLGPKNLARAAQNAQNRVVRSDDKMSQLLTQLQSQHEVGSGSGSGGDGDDEPGEHEDTDEDEDVDGDVDS
ncbi:hypothetical protein Tco_0066735 [Tanacetum coccineum]